MNEIIPNVAQSGNLIDPFKTEPYMIGFRKLPFVPVDYWRPRSPEDIIFTPSKGFITVPVASAYCYQPSTQPKDIDLFYLNTKRCYNNMRDHIANYLNYFEKYYDGDHELWGLYIYLKLLMDTQTSKYPEERFKLDLKRLILNPYCTIFAKVNQMNEENYYLNLTYRNNRNPALQYTNYHAKLMMRASVLMNIVIPLITHYMNRARISNTQDFILEIFMHILDNLCDNVRIVNKLYETAFTNISKNANSNPILWEIQDIRGKSVETHTINCVDNIIVSIMPKYVYDQNIIHFNYKSIINNTKFQVTDIAYEFTFVKVSSVDRDADNNSEFDKFESFLTKENESNYFLIAKNYEKTMRDLEFAWGPIDPEEIMFYHQELSRGENYEIDEHGNMCMVQDEHSCIKSMQKNMIFLLFLRYFGHSYCLREVNYLDYIKLIIIAKKMLKKAGMIALPDIISGRFEVSKIKSINIKEKARIESSKLYAEVQQKYQNAKMMDLVLEMISKVLASKFVIIDYENEALNGQPIPMYNEIIIHEMLMYILMI